MMHSVQEENVPAIALPDDANAAVAAPVATVAATLVPDKSTGTDKIPGTTSKYGTPLEQLITQDLKDESGDSSSSSGSDDSDEDPSSSMDSVTKGMSASAPGALSLDLGSSSERGGSERGGRMARSGSPLSKSTRSLVRGNARRRQGIAGSSQGVSPSSRRSTKHPQRKSSRGAGYRRTSSQGEGQIVRHRTRERRTQTPEELNAIRETAAEMIEKVSKQHRASQHVLKKPVLKGSKSEGIRPTKTNSGSSRSREQSDDDDISPMGSTVSMPNSTSAKPEASSGDSASVIPASTSLGFRTRTLGRMFDNDDEEVVEVDYPMPQSLGSRDSQKRAKSKGFANPLRFPVKTGSDSSESSLSRFTASLFSSPKRESPPDNQPRLGSTFLAERDERFRKGVDQSINLMDASNSNYGGSPERDSNRDSMQRARRSFSRSISPNPNGKRQVRGGRRPNAAAKRGSVLEIMFGGGMLGGNNDPESIPRVPRGRTRNARKSMVDINIRDSSQGRDKENKRFFAEIDEEDNDESLFCKIKKRIPTGCCIILVLLHFIGAVFGIAVLIRCALDQEKEFITASPAPSPTVGPTTLQTTANALLNVSASDIGGTLSMVADTVRSVVVPEHDDSKESALDGIEAKTAAELDSQEEKKAGRTGSEEEKEAASSDVEDEEDEKMVYNEGAKISRVRDGNATHATTSDDATNEGANATDATSLVLESTRAAPASFGTSAKPAADEDNYWNDDILNNLESLVRRYDLTSKEDLRNPQSPQYGALQWLGQFRNRRRAIEVDDTDEQDADDKEIEIYSMAVFYFATHPPARVKQPTDDESSENSHRRRSLLRGGDPDQQQASVENPSDERHLEESIDITGREWMNDDMICDWKGIRCKDQVVTHLKLQEGRLHGTIPSEIKGFRNLLQLDLSHNALHGTIPEAIGEMSTLTYLDLKMTKLKGTIPESVTRLTGLHSINLERNSLTGTLPSLHGFTSLKYFMVSNNKFEGTIPPFENMPELTLLYLNCNSLTGEIPFEALGKLEKLEEIRAMSNMLSGTLPKSIGGMEKLVILNLKSNQIGGTLPDSFENPKLVELDLGLNALQGPLPPSIGNLSQLKTVKLYNNHLTGSIPETWSKLSKLRSVILHHNYLVGEIPTYLPEMESLLDIRLNHNMLSGPIPQMPALERLSHLHLNNNHLTGAIPPVPLDNLQTLLLFANNIAGDASAVCSKDVSGLQRFAADCKSGVACECCQECY